MSMDDERLKSILAAASGLGIGLQRRKFDGDVADLVAEGRTDFAPAVAITMYFDGPRDRFADGVVACWEEFLQGYGDRLTWYADEDLGKWREATVERLRRPTARLRNSKAMPFYAWTTVSGERFEDASPVTFSVTVRDGVGKNLSYLRATFPVTLVASEASVEELLATVQRWCERVPILHGYAGFTVNQSPQDHQLNSGMLLQIAEKFAGFEIDDCGGTILVARDLIKGVNWLTLLGQSFVARMGGESALRNRLSTNIRLYVLSSGGMMLQAGRFPSRGDSAKGDDLQSYREVARALRPICLDEHPALGPAEHGSFGREKTQLWLRRFE